MEPGRVGAHRLPDGSNTAGGLGIARFGWKPVTGVDADDGVSGEIIENVGIDRLGSVAAALGESAAVNEDQPGSGYPVRCGGMENFEGLPLMRSIGGACLHLDPFRWRMPEHLAAFVDHQPNSAFGSA